MKLAIPKGFRFAATYAGIRKVAKDDVALIVADPPAAAAGVFTKNLVAAAPVLLSRANLQASGGRVRALLINAGNANCATRTGQKVATASVKALAKALGCAPEQVLPSSTGVIGVELDGGKLTAPLPALVESLKVDAFEKVASAIMTTDLVMKTAGETVKLPKGEVRVAGMTKGSGMIQPNMATTLGYILCDAAIAPKQLQRILSQANQRSYNRLTVDGDTSTNDTVILLASGASGVTPKGEDLAKVTAAIERVMQSLAAQIARDGEGAKKLVTIHVEGAATEADADKIGRAIANSPLVKTAIAGSDANWGRILCAAGYSGARFDPAKVDIHLQGKRVCKAGLAAPFDEPALKKSLDSKDVRIRFRIAGEGSGTATFWTCDLTEGYIEINGSYRT